MRINVFVKFMVVAGLVAFLVGLIGSIISINQQQKFYENNYLEKGQSIGRSLDATISNRDLENATNLKGSLYKFLLLNPDVLEITVYTDQHGALTPLVSTTETESIHQDLDDIKNTFDNNKTTHHKEINSRYNQTVLDLFIPLHVSGKVSGVYSILISLQELEETIKVQTRNLITLGVIAVFAFVIGISALIRFVVTKPLGNLVVLAANIEKGDFDISEKKWANDEIGDLARAFYKMAIQLKYSYQGLEERVKEKTKLLSVALDDSKRQNKNLEENKAAMLNLLEDARELDEKLKIEKQNVEKKIIERTKELAEEKTKLLASIEGIVRGYMLFDINGVPTIINKKMSQILGSVEGPWTKKEVQKKLNGIMDVDQEVKNCLKKEFYFEIKEVAFGSKIIDIHMVPIYIEKAGIKENIGVLLLIGDITEEKIIQRSKDEFFSIASHELRTPLTAIRGNTDLINQYFSDKIKDPQLKEMIKDIHESSIRLIDIVNDFLEMSRLEMKKIDFKKVKIDMAKLIEKTIAEFQVTGSRKKLHLELEKPTKEIPEAMADIDRTKQVIINLIGNGLKYTEEGGVKITLTTEPGFIKVSIIDTGRGISPEGQKLLFRKFQQAGDSLITRDTTKSTGLGLYINKLLVEGMGGKIWLEKSEEGKGSTFSFTLPV
ncbi:MAG: ATPase, histidine kinase-, DNA gyrase B-, and HSP90-like protein domain protein [Candidatus Roizmanbacteria bacterium GW2011_GWA2_35_19]|uniref:histidine kinase n=2 Tax=Candidatus Roizmaniibacteriota TaxID=1752723 RepID=A0A0G0BRT0_9BACT|nr:MAG: ATPase, histidine kinase-, DNA gyrase B-, and HSP90-like protein domain protein [Candidatus Roizmanbacteria bacterium GW2011_GWC2_35_12]KKP72159.1 MAG: ATPase, histidine kinase-, DNA gyrase B-, and HSP90-like protein domain protein [Candidatus Roizmanbacteria bacterium GW2011_GWA2_35_19]